MNDRNPPQKRISDDEVIARAERVMARASDKAMADYKRFGIEPVISNPTKRQESTKP